MTTTTDPHAECAHDGCGHAQDEHSRLAGCTAQVNNGAKFCTCQSFKAKVPVTPYDGGTSSGHSGSSTSEDRSRQEDADGTTKHRQQRVLDLLSAVGKAKAHPTGITVKELRERTGWHHGQASAALSNLHQASLIARLTEVRDRCKVYVLAGDVKDRPTEPHGQRQAKSKGKRRGPVTLTPAEADALRRMASMAAATRDDRTSIAVGLEDVRLVTAALEARVREPRQ